jgi:hypothetical protein
VTGLLAALLGLIAAIAGGLLQAAATRRFEKIRFSRQAKWELYSSYFVILGKLSFSERGTDEHTAALAEMAQIRARIALVATSEVIRTVGVVFSFPDLKSSSAQHAMALALRAMRRDVGEVDCVIDEQLLRALMFGSAEITQ